MSIWNKILVGLLIAVSPVLFYTATRSLQTYAVWQDAVRKYEKRIAYYQNELAKTEPQVDRLHVQLHGVLADRRRAWFKCEPKLPVKISRNDGAAEVSVAIDQMNHGIAKATVLHVFETPSEAGKSRYLGEFTATNVGDKQVTLVPTSKLSSQDLDRLEKAKRPWTLYEILPHDSHEVFASLSDAQKKAILPDETLQEYLDDGKPAGAAAPKNRVGQNGNYVRQLRDYGFLFNLERNKAIHLRESIAISETDNKQLAEAVADAKKEEDASAKDVVRATEELKDREHERDAVAAYFNALNKATDDAQAAIVKLVNNNRVMAGQIAKYQLEAVKRIDQRTRAMAQSGTGESNG
jgi:hypothetical protein